MPEVPNENRYVRVIGHRNPDTDSICSAIAYSKLRNILHPEENSIPCRAGALNRETEYVLSRFSVPVPQLCLDVSPQIRDVDIRRMPGVDGETSLRKAWMIMRDQEIDTLCIVENERLKGVITVKDIATANMDQLNTHMLAEAHTSYQNIVETLDAEVLAGDVKGKVVQGKIMIAAGSPEQMEQGMEPGDVVILGNRAEGQLTAIEMDAGCIVVCVGSRVSRTILRAAEERGTILLRTNLNTYVAGQMITQAAPIRHYMVSDGLLTFTMDTLVEDATRIMAKVRHRYFPVLSGDRTYLGVVSRRNLMNLHKKQLVLVDHNEKTQAAEGLEEAEVLEIIDHHRLNAPETDGPVYFRNVPVGCTCTILWQMYQENDVEIPPTTAGLMLSAILSDTLMFRSPTCTPIDQKAARDLAKIAGVDLEEYADAMFEAGGDITGKTAEEIFNGDYKRFTCGDIRFGVGQSSYMSEKNRKAAEALVAPYLATAQIKQTLHYIFYMFTDVRTSTTEVYMVGENADAVIRRAFQAEVTDNVAVLPGVVSRKKQMIPALINAMKAMAEEE